MKTMTNARRTVKPARTRKPTAPFGVGLADSEPEPAGPSCPIDSRPLPAIDGTGLHTEEWTRMNGRRNDAQFRYAVDVPDASPGEIDAVGARAASDAAAPAPGRSPGRPAPGGRLLLVHRGRSLPRVRGGPGARADRRSGRPGDRHRGVGPGFWPRKTPMRRS